MRTLLAASLLFIPLPALAGNAFSLGVGFNYSTGKYGESTSTDILSVPVTAKYEMETLTLKLVVPYISISGPGGVIPGMGALAAGIHGFGRPASFGAPGRPLGEPPGLSPDGPPGRRRSAVGSSDTATNAGLGDLVASADHEFYSAGALTLDVVGKVKFGTADSSKGLGSGQNDYSLQLDIGYQFPRKTYLFATTGYKLVGAPEGVSVNNVVYGTLGFSQPLSAATSAGVMLNYAQSALVGGSNLTDITLFASNKLSRNTKVQASLLKGLADGSPDFGIGATISEYF